MANISILNPTDQPTGKIRLLNELRSCLESDDYNSFKMVVAFAKQGPLLRLEDHIDKWISDKKSLEAIYGIDAQGTSREALDFSLKHFSEVRIAHASPSSYSSTFHPKIYFFKGAEKSKVYIGSNNLTVGGLESNFESYICLDLSNSEDTSLLESVESMWLDTKNLSKKLDEDFLVTLKASGFLLTEQAMRQKGSKEKRLFIERQTVNKKEFDFPYLAVVPPSKLSPRPSSPTSLLKVKYIVFRYLTAADFFNIYKPGRTETRGGGQAYIDFPIDAVSMEQWNTFFAKSTKVRKSSKTNGPSWEFTVNSIGNEKNQELTIYQRRAQTVCIASQKITSRQENRVNAWRPENGFPEPLDPTDRDSVPENLLVFIARTTDDEFWAGWTLDKDYSKSSSKSLKQMASRGKDGHAGFVQPAENIQINIEDIENPFSPA